MLNDGFEPIIPNKEKVLSLESSEKASVSSPLGEKLLKIGNVSTRLQKMTQENPDGIKSILARLEKLVQKSKDNTDIVEDLSEINAKGYLQSTKTDEEAIELFNRDVFFIERKLE